MAAPRLTDLPVEDAIDELQAELGGHGVAVLSAAPGAGKTTVVPLRLLGEPWLADQRIVMLEPRRLAARAAARRMAALLDEEVGGRVGYRTRVDRAISARTRIEVVTEGILTRRLQRDPELEGVGLVIFDEFHERSLQADLGLALTLDVRRGLRPDLRILVMSATLDTDRVAALVGDDQPAAIVEAAGQAYPVDISWAPRDSRTRVEDATVMATLGALDRHPGDALVFLAGAAQIRRVVADLGRATAADVDVRPLFGALSPAEQDAALRPSGRGRRKVVVATDIAESSLTVEGVRLVVDSGLRRVMRHDLRTGMGRLRTTNTSQASADQRAGRAGREGPGHAIRLWSKAEHATRAAFEAPEIALADLTGFLLEVASWGAGPDELALLDPPGAGALDEARRLLTDLGAVDAGGRITAVGRSMLAMPLHPRLAAMVVGAAEHAWTACVAAAVLEEGDVLRGRPHELPVDLGIRLALVEDRTRSHPQLSGDALRRARDEARDLARRVDVKRGAIDPDAVGPLLLLAYPDRVARSRQGRGRFLLASGQGASMAESEPLAAEEFVVIPDLDGAALETSAEARARLAAAVDLKDIRMQLGEAIESSTVTTWDDERRDVVSRREERLGALTLRSAGLTVEPGPEVVALLLDRVRTSELEVLGWTDRARRLQARIELTRGHRSFGAPPVDDGALIDDLEAWLGPLLASATGMKDVRRVDMTEALFTRIGWHQRPELDRLAPEDIELPSGRRVPIDYTRDRPTIRGKVQEFYGSAVAPAVLAGAVPLTIELLSPADRPIQVTADLAGFWVGSWQDVRKEMAGRYPKHRWPEDPTTAAPGPSTQRRPR